MAPLKWGIAGAGKVSHDFCNCLNALKPEHQITAVAARDMDRAKLFAQSHKIETFYNHYEKLAKDVNIDVVYIGSIHPTHYNIANIMLHNGKHVVCEKPMTLSVEQTTDLTRLAKENKLFLMEGVWSRFTPVYSKMKEIIESGAIGEVLSVMANFCMPFAAQIERLKRKDLGGGIIMDIGIYLFQLAHFIFGPNTTAEHFVGHTMDTGVDDYCAITLQYQNGKQLAHLLCDGRYKLDNIAYINGTKGSLKIPDFWTPTSLVAPDKTYVYDKACESPLEMNFHNSENFCYQIRHVKTCIDKGMLESDLMPHCDSIYLAKIMNDACAALGIKYEY